MAAPADPDRSSAAGGALIPRSRPAPSDSPGGREGAGWPSEPTELLRWYGQLAAELEETTEPARQADLRRWLDELDARLDLTGPARTEDPLS
ncbi:hypothetical protein FHX42_003444 [Saccharopolyspora lacisalsi]|uniref:Uncharacterized protein n=1 Tax=Halosaccharopolyspora lacisalsi TaxID=1000566 RepID=A0A839E592_9PSEU|nr:hypothetical protein [Halosaccharopolyspora lacisalsi]MBA8826068.1 hypothetical protein [Halosaccharopolyspora lacisalsi]